MSTAPSAGSDGNPTADSNTELDKVKADLAWAQAELKHIQTDIGDSWWFHDMAVYGGMYLTLWLASVPAGAGWDALIAAAPTAAMSLLRRVMGNQL
jgi:hypothetical protein